MIKRNLTLILVILAMLLQVLNFDYTNFSLESKKFWLFIGAMATLVATVIMIFMKEHRLNKKPDSHSE